MKILYRQGSEPSIMSKHEIIDCCLKQMAFNTDAKKCTKKIHHHNEFEIHIIIKGRQFYKINEICTTLTADNIMIIPPKTYHQALEYDENTEKFAITFKLTPHSRIFELSEENDFYIFPAIQEISDGFKFIIKEVKNNKSLSLSLIENRLFEILVMLFRKAGMYETQAETPVLSTSPILSMAKQYITDNIESSLSVHDIALYCHISDKQLSRIFLRYENMSAFDYIRAERIAYAQKLLRESNISSKEISERMNFSSEYYFNNFFKNNCGVPPGEYRKMT